MSEHIFIIKLHFKIWKAFGLWRASDESRVYKVYRIVFHFLFSLLILGSIIVGALASNSVEDFFTQTLYMALTEMAMATKLIVGFMQFSSIYQLHGMVLCTEFQPNNNQEQALAGGVLKKINAMYSAYCLWCMWGVLSNFTYLFDGQYKLPFFPWLLGIPYGANLPYNYGFLWTYQVAGIGIHAIINVVTDTQIGYLLAVAGIQMDFLAGRLREMSCLRNGGNQLEFERLYRGHIAHFNNINGYIKEVERVYSKPLFSQFCASGITICAIAFRLSSVNIVEEFGTAMPMAVYMLSMTIQIFLPCYFGNELTLKSERLHHALYSSEWYRMKVKNQKDIHMFMVRSVRPVTLKAGGYFFYNLGSFTATLNMAYSLFCVLQRRAQSVHN